MIRIKRRGDSHLSQFLGNDQVALPDRAPFLSVPCLPTCGLGSESRSLADLQLKEPSLVLGAPRLSEGGRKGTDLKEGSQPVDRGVEHLNYQCEE